MFYQSKSKEREGLTFKGWLACELAPPPSSLVRYSLLYSKMSLTMWSKSINMHWRKLSGLIWFNSTGFKPRSPAGNKLFTNTHGCESKQTGPFLGSWLQGKPKLQSFLHRFPSRCSPVCRNITHNCFCSSFKSNFSQPERFFSLL